MNSTDKRKQVIAGLAVIVIIAVIVVAGMAATQKPQSVSTTETITTESPSSDAAASATPTSATKASGTTSAPAATQAYKDGTYSSTGSYSSPGGNESISVTVTLKNGVITSTTAQGNASDSESSEYQSKFVSGYKSLVVGKSIDTVSLSRVSGSSLTSKGFNSAINTIKAQAKT